jgi:hypothetical protein
LDADSASVHFNLNVVLFDASQFDANPYTGCALKHVNVRMPLWSGVLKLREVDLRDLVGNFAKLILDEAQAERTGFSAHVL